ncbi:MAG: hypothetical protein PVI91_15580 [Gammaproteobacteria bacterium]|jgi:hypothetical protein
MNDIFQHITVDTIGRVDTIANTADFAYYAVGRHVGHEAVTREGV